MHLIIVAHYLRRMYGFTLFEFVRSDIWCLKLRCSIRYPISTTFFVHPLSLYNLSPQSSLSLSLSLSLSFHQFLPPPPLSLSLSLLAPGPWQTTVAMLGKFGITASFAIIYVFSAELFPTPVRYKRINPFSYSN